MTEHIDADQETLYGHPDEHQAAISQLWDARADLEEQAGTRDLIAKEIEVEAIAKYVKDGMRVLDAGCGNGVTALELARRYDVDIVAFDASVKMIAAATDRWRCKSAELRGRVELCCVDVLNLPRGIRDASFDLIYTERTLINIPERADRERAVVGLCNLLKPRGLYVMCENSQAGVDRLNRVRVKLSLPEIVPPWHNHYLHWDDIVGFEHAVEGVAVYRWADDDDYSSTYYFLSRIVNAALAAERGEEPAYDAPINQLARRLPSIGDFGQGRIWLWRRL